VSLPPIGIGLPSSARAAPPSNDGFANPVTVTTLPFRATINTVDATTEPGASFRAGAGHTTWYVYTAASIL
jgi:hypothetical protein